MLQSKSLGTQLFLHLMSKWSLDRRGWDRGGGLAERFYESPEIGRRRR